MPPFNRFAPSKYKNQLLEPAKADKSFSELPSVVPATNPNGRSIACGYKHIAFSLGNSVGLVDWKEPGKLGGKVQKWESAGSGSVRDVNCSPIDPTMVAVVTSDRITCGWSDDQERSNFGMPGKYSTIEFHPHSRELLSVSDDKGIRVCSITQSSHSISLTTEETTKQHFWSPHSGTQIVSHSISNVLSIFDPRSSPTAHMQCATGYQVNRPSHSAFLDDTTVIVSGTTASTRSRSLKLYDLRSPTTPKSIIPFDSSSSPSTSLVPLIDYQRRLAYIVQSHSSSIYAFDFNDPNPVPTTLQLPSTIVGATLLPPTEVDVMRGEINRLFVLTRKDEITPISVRIERKSYMDFHADLFPDPFAPWGGLHDAEWYSGSDKVREKVSLDPSKQGWRKRLDEEVQQTLDDSKRTPDETESEEPTSPLPQSTDTKSVVAPPSLTSTLPVSGPSADETPPSQPSSASTTTNTIATAASSTLPSTYTRKFLTGRLHHPSKHYTSLPPTPATTSLRRTLSITSTHLAFPLSGPGGRIAIIPLSKTGRNETPQTFSNGSALVDFSINPHRKKGDSELPMKIFCAGEDGRITVVEIKQDELAKEIETDVVCQLEGMEKVIQGEWHPLARDLIAVLCHDSGKSEIRLWDISNGEYRRIALAYSAYGIAWSSDGTKIIVAGADNAVHVLDPRSEEEKEIWVGKEANASSRQFSAIFCGNFVVSVGFARGSSRQICLYDTTQETPIQKLVLDMSPSALTPYYDDDTSVLFLWSKGSRQIHAYHLTVSPPSLNLLPSFDASDLQVSIAWLPKTIVNVENVEIIQGLRLAAGNKIERFGFSIPRNRTEFFQDDIFIPTTNTEVAILSAQEWLEGTHAEPSKVDLRPMHMIPRILLLFMVLKEVSQAPTERKTSVKSSGVSSFQRVLSEKEKEMLAREEMFQKAKKLDLSDEEIEGIPKTGNTDAGFDDDDWN